MFRATGALCVSRRANATGAVEFVDCGVDSPVFCICICACRMIHVSAPDWAGHDELAYVRTWHAFDLTYTKRLT